MASLDYKDSDTHSVILNLGNLTNRYLNELKMTYAFQILCVTYLCLLMPELVFAWRMRERFV